MTLPRLRFVAYHDYYIITIENLTALSVPQIQQLEAFAAARRSRLDFNRSSIRIWKRIDFEHFNQTLQHAGILAETLEPDGTAVKAEPSRQAEAPKHVTAKVGFGKHRGLAYAELPDDYLLWLKRNYQGRERVFIEEELAARNL